MNETVNDRIQRRLKELNISEAKASVDAGLSISGIRNIRRRNGIPRGDTLQKLARILKVTPDWLMGGDMSSGIMQTARSVIGGRVEDHGLEAGFIPELDIFAGAGGGGYPLPAIINDGERNYEAEVVRDQWRFPDRFLRDELHVDLSFVDIVQVRGDSMKSSTGDGFDDGDRVMINRRDRAIRQGGIFAIRDDREVIIKQVELVRVPAGGDEAPRIKCTSINPRYNPFELVLDGSADIIGRVVCRISRV